MLGFSERLGIILEDRPPQYNPLNYTTKIVHELQTARKQVVVLQHKLDTAKQQINRDLAIGIRKNSELNISLDSYGCKIGYKSNNLLFDPNIEAKTWEISGNNAQQFKKYYGKTIQLSSNIDGLVLVIVNYFTKHYKSLGEDIIGTGTILVEGKRVSLLELTTYFQFIT